jgi:hypothetical protein
MKKAITFWIEDDAEAVALCGSLAIKRTENIEKNYGADGLQMFNFSPESLKPEFFCPINGKMKEVRDGKVVEE